MLDKLNSACNWLLPRLCGACGLVSDNPHIDLCSHCHVLLPWFKDGCHTCGAFLKNPIVSQNCDKCSQATASYDCLHALFRYRAPVSGLIYRLKFRHQLFAAKLFARLLADAILHNWYKEKIKPQVIIPVPLQIKQTQAIGFNQCVEIGSILAKLVGIAQDASICWADQERFIARYCGYDYAAILVDVVASGNTIRAMSSALLARGVKNIDVWCVCRR